MAHSVELRPSGLVAGCNPVIPNQNGKYLSLNDTVSIVNRNIIQSNIKKEITSMSVIFIIRPAKASICYVLVQSDNGKWGNSMMGFIPLKLAYFFQI